LRLERDIFYRNDPGGSQMGHDREFELKDDVDNSQDEFLMLGDNSPPQQRQSALADDARRAPASADRQGVLRLLAAWRSLLEQRKGYPIGKYSEPRPRGGGETHPPLPKFSVPFYPQVGRMHRIR